MKQGRPVCSRIERHGLVDPAVMMAVPRAGVTLSEQAHLVSFAAAAPTPWTSRKTRSVQPRKAKEEFRFRTAQGTAVAKGRR